MPYNTGNAMPSKDPRDLHDNASNFDSFSNGSAATYLDRFGVPRRSLAGVGMAFDESQLARDAQFQAFLAAAGYVWIGDYAAGITFTVRNQYIVRSGSQYRVAPTVSLPLVLTGTWATDQPLLVLMETAGTIMSQLSANTGAALIGTSESITVQAALNARLKSNINLASIDLNTLTGASSIGVYRQATDSSATLALHYPVAAVGGTLEVYAGSGDLAAQEFTTKTLQKFIRWCSDAATPTWTAWREISPPLGGTPGQVFTNTGSGIGKWADPSYQAGTYRKLRITYPAVSSTSTNTATTADWLVLANASGETVKLLNWNQSALQGAVGASSKLDAGVWASDTPYHLFAIYNPTSNTRDLVWSLSSSAPTLPAGYTFYMRIGGNVSVSFSQSGRLRQGVQINNRFEITSVGTGALASGAVGTWNVTTPTFASVSVASQVPSTANKLRAVISAVGALGTLGSSGTMAVAPDASYGGPISTNPAPYCNNANSTSASNPSVISVTVFEMALTSSTIYVVSTGTGVTLRVMGWEDEL